MSFWSIRIKLTDRPGVCTVLGAVVGASAQVQAASDRRKTVDTYLEQVNKEYFGPLGIEALSVARSFVN